MSQKSLRVALIGVGNHGPLFPTILEHSGRGSKIVALVDTNPKALKEASEAMDVPECARFSSTKELLEKFRDGIDAAIVALPATVRGPVVDCLGAGLHVFCENPLALDYMTACQAVSVSRQKNRALCTDEQWALLPAMQILSRAIGVGRLIGTVEHVTLVGKGRFSEMEFIRIGTHLLSVAQRAGVGNYTSCCAYAAKGTKILSLHITDPSPHLELVRATFTTTRGIFVHMDFSREGSGEKSDVRRCFIELKGTKGRVRAIGGLLEQVWITPESYDTGDAMNSWERLYPTEARIQEGAWEIIRPGDERRVLLDPFMNPTFNLWNQFESACTGGIESRTFPDMINVAAACGALHQSILCHGTKQHCAVMF